MEFVGVSGIGKTTFLNRISNQNLREGWFLTKDLYRFHPAESLDSLKSINREQETVYRFMLNSVFDELIAKQEFPFSIKVDIFHYLINVVKYDVFMRNSSFPKGFMLDEGIVHNFAKEIVALYSLAKNGNFSLDETVGLLFKNRALVYLSASEDYIIGNLKKRENDQTAVINNWYPLLGNDRLTEFVREKILIAGQIFRIAGELNVPTLHLDVENENFDALSIKMHKFLSSVVPK